jgi:tryptophan synthase alpha chain
MNRIGQTFQRLKTHGRKGFIPFVTAGDPDLDTSLEIIKALAKCGADIIELGVPFSDPMADGPTIQASSQRALANGMTLNDVLELVRQFRLSSDVPIVLFSYLNPLLRYGMEKLAFDAAKSGVEGILITDVVDQEAGEIANLFRRQDIDLISLVAPTSTVERLQRIAENASGFLYAIARTGVTGASSESSNTAETLVERARRFSDLPIAVGFGISTAEQVDDVWMYADAAVVGSAIVNVISDSVAGEEAANVKAFVHEILPAFAKTQREI